MNTINLSSINAAFSLIACILLFSCAALAQGVTITAITGGNSKSPIFPAYPPEAAAKKVHGLVQVSITVDERGSVISAKAVSGDALLQPAAVAAAAQTKFDLQTVKGQAAKFDSIIVYNFVLPSDSSSGNNQNKDFLDPNYDFFSQSPENYLTKNADSIQNTDKDQNAGKDDKNEEIYNRAKKYFDRADYKSVISELDKILLGQRSEYCLLLARANYALKDYPKALEAGNEAVRMGEREQESGSFIKGWVSPNLLSAYYRRGEIYEALGDDDQAAADYRRAHELAPDDPLPKEKIAGLAARRNKPNEIKAAANPAPKFKSDFDEFKSYFDEYQRLSKIYETKYEIFAQLAKPFAEAQEAQSIGNHTPLKLPDNTQMCRSAVETYNVYRQMSVQYDKMQALIDADKMDKYPDIKKDIADEEDALAERGADVLSAQYKWGCKID